MFVMSLFLCHTVHAASKSVWIVYPDNTETDKHLYGLVLDGIRSELGSDEISHEEIPLASSWEQRLQATSPDIIIPLGSEALARVATRVDADKIMAGGVEFDGRPRQIGGVRATVNPRAMLDTLLLLLPAIKRIHVVVGREPTRQWNELAQHIIATYKIELIIHTADKLDEAAIHFHNIFEYGNPSTDAVWLVDSGPPSSRDVILPKIVEESWSRHFPVFSSIAEHVRLGALFSVYPEPKKLGQQIGLMAMARVQNRHARREMEFVDHPASSINVRVASHLDITITPAIRRQFDLVLGSP